MGRFEASQSRDPVVNTTNWFLLVAAILSVFFRLGTKLWMFHTLTDDDYLIVVSLIFCGAESIAISMAVANGYGDHFATIDRAQFDAVMKSQYSAFLLYTLSLYFSKLSFSVFIRNLTPAAKDHVYAAILQIMLTGWAILALFGSAFSCKVPRTWDYRYGQCFDLEAWKYYFCASNIMTDILIVTQALLLIGRIQASLKKKITFASIFLTRVFVVIASIAELALTRDIAHSDDPTFDTYEVTIVMQVVQSLSIITACWGQLKPFLNKLKSNGLRIQGMEYENFTAKGPYAGSYGQHDAAHSTQGNNHELIPGISRRPNTTLSALRTWDASSQSSQTGMIRETQTWRVEGRQSERSNRS